jgi:hypothetical protein
MRIRSTLGVGTIVLVRLPIDQEIISDGPQDMPEEIHARAIG